jgi:drug/metabolite transporter (DMT)-like permease
VDTDHLLALLLGVSLALVGAAYATTLGDRVDGILRATAVGSLIGTMVAYRRQRRRPDLDPFPVITRWSYVGFLGGVLLLLLDALT